MAETSGRSGVPEEMLQTPYAGIKENKGRGAIHDIKFENIEGKSRAGNLKGAKM